MTTELIANSPVPGTPTAIATLAAAISTAPASGTSEQHAFSGAAPSALQGSGQFRIVIDAEIMIVTAGATGSTWTVTRGAEGTTTTGHSNGANVYHFLTAGALENLLSAAGGGSGSGFVAPTSVETGTQAISSGQMLLLDISSASGTGDLPNAPSNGTVCGIKAVKVNATPGTYTATLACSGSDTFYGGGTSLTLKALGESRVVAYESGVWYTVASDPALGNALGAPRLGNDGTLAGPSGSQPNSGALAPAASSATALAITATSAWQIANINANGLPGFATLPSVVGAAATSPYSTYTALTPLVGDGSTNDQIALRNLVHYLGAAYLASGGSAAYTATSQGVAQTIYCPTGDYSIHDSGTIWRSGVCVKGDGPANTRFFMSNPVNTTNPVPWCTFTTSGASASATNCLTDCTFEGFLLDGSNVSLSSYNVGAKGFDAAYWLRGTWKNIVIQNMGASGFGCDQHIDSHIENVRCYNNGRLNPGNGLGGAGLGIGTGDWMEAGYTNEGGTVLNCTARGNGTHGLFFESQSSSNPLPKGWRVIGGRYEGNQFGISDWGCDGLVVVGAHLVNNLQHGFNVSGASGVANTAGVNGLVDGCVIDGNGQDGICIGDSNLYKVGGLNRISNNGRHGVHWLNVHNSSSTGMASVRLAGAEIWNNGGSGVYVDAVLNNPFLLSNSSRNNGLASGASISNSGSSVTYTALGMTDTSATWTVNGYVGRTVTVGSSYAIVQSNTATTMTFWPVLANGSTGWSSVAYNSVTYNSTPTAPTTTPSNGTAYSVGGAAADRAGLTVNNTMNHPVIHDNRCFSDNSTQPYGWYITSSGTVSNGNVTDNDFNGNATGAYSSAGSVSGGYWSNNAGLTYGTVSSPSTTIIDGAAYIRGATTIYGELTIPTGGAAITGTTSITGSASVSGALEYAAAARVWTGSAVDPSATANTAGSGETLSPNTGQQGFALLLLVRGAFASVGSETVTLNITATFSDNSTAAATITSTSSTTVVWASGTEIALHKDGLYVKSLAFSAQSTIANSTATVTPSVVALQC